VFIDTTTKLYHKKAAYTLNYNMREDKPIHQSTTCNCPTAGCGCTDIEEFGKTFENIGKGMYNNSSANMRRSSTRLPELNTTRLRRSAHGMDASTTNIVDTLALCTCQQSRSYPFCDNTHKTINKETNSSHAPIIVAIVEDNNKLCSECSAKLTGDNTKANDNTPHPTDNTIDTSNFLEEKILKDKTTIGDLYNSSREPPLVDTSSEPSPCTNFDSPSDPVHTPPHPTITPSSIKNKINQQNIFTIEEIALHNTKDSLWMIIKGNVYDITTYVPSHPGGERALLKFAGRDGTENVQFHSSKMLEILNSRYFIGRLHTDEPPSKCIIS